MVPGTKCNYSYVQYAFSSCVQLGCIQGAFRFVEPSKCSLPVPYVCACAYATYQHHIFGGSKQRLKASILEEPALLEQSLKRTI